MEAVEDALARLPYQQINARSTRTRDAQSNVAVGTLEGLPEQGCHHPNIAADEGDAAHPQHNPHDEATGPEGLGVGCFGGGGESVDSEIARSYPKRRRAHSPARLGLGGSEPDPGTTLMSSRSLLSDGEDGDQGPILNWGLCFSRDEEGGNPLVAAYKDLQRQLEIDWLARKGNAHAYVVCRDGKPFLHEGSCFWQYRDFKLDTSGWSLSCLACKKTCKPPTLRRLQHGQCVPAHAIYHDVLGKHGAGGMQGSAIDPNKTTREDDWQARLQVLIQDLSRSSMDASGTATQPRSEQEAMNDEKDEDEEHGYGEMQEQGHQERPCQEDQEEVATRLTKLQDDITAHYLAREQRVHALVVCVRGRPVPLAHPAYTEYAKGPFEEAGVVIRCLRCGLQTETRRWKQVRERACRKPTKEARKRERDQGHQEGWNTVAAAHDFMQQVLQAGQDIPQRHRHLLGRVCDCARACLESSRTRELVQAGIGAGGEGVVKISTLNVGTLRGRAGGFQGITDAAFVQETMATHQMTRSVDADARSTGFSFYQGMPARVSQDRSGRVGLDHPYQVLLGDFQNRPRDLPDLAGLFRSGWISSCSIGDSAEVPTNHPVVGESRVLDALVISPALATRWAGFEVRRVEEYSTHSLVSVSFLLNCSEAPSSCLVPPLALPEELPRHTTEWWERTCERCLYDSDQDAYQAFQKALNTWLRDVGAKGKGHAGKTLFFRKDQDAVRRCQGRFTSPSLWRRNVLNKLIVHLDELNVLLDVEEPRETRRSRIEHLQACLRRMQWNQVGYPVPAFPLQRHDIEGIRAELCQLKRECEAEIQERVRRWQQRMKTSIKGNKREMAKWVREESASLKGVRDGERVVTNPVEVLSLIRDAWIPVYMSSEQVEPLKEEEEVGLAVRYTLEPVEARELRAALEQRSKGAPGPDGMSIPMLKNLPLCMWELAARTLRQVELTAEWPEDLRWVRIAVLRKPGTEAAPEAGKVRLIAVENLLVRCWATCRAQSLMPWLKRVIGDGVIGGVAGRAAMPVAASRDLARTLCRARSVAWGEVSYDFSKCFDTLPRALLLDLAEAKGMPRAVVRAIAAWLGTAKRFLVFRGRASEEVPSSRGVPQGNALSVTLAIVCASVWHAQTVSLVSQGCMVVAYLDDFNVSTTHPQDIQRSIGITVCFAERWKIQLNQRKRCVVLSEHSTSWDIGQTDIPKEAAWGFLGMCMG